MMEANGGEYTGGGKTGKSEKSGKQAAAVPGWSGDMGCGQGIVRGMVKRG